MRYSLETSRYLYNLSQLGEIFDINRSTVRKKLLSKGVQPFAIEGGVPVYILAEAAFAIAVTEIEKKANTYGKEHIFVEMGNKLVLHPHVIKK